MSVSWLSIADGGSPYPGFPGLYLAWCLAELGEFAEGLTYGDEALRLVEGDS